MRLPWPFGRRTPSDGPSADTPEGPAPAVPSASPAADTAVPPTGAWSTLPPIQRAVGAPPLVAPAAPFLDDVPGHRALPPIVQPLGHEAGPTAPPGLVVARPAASPVLTSRTELPLQRRVGTPASVEPLVDAGVDAGPPPGAVPVRTLRAVSPASTVTPAARPLTQAPAVVAPVAQRAARATTASAAGSPAAGVPTAAVAPAATTGARAGASTAPLPSPRGTPPVRVSRWAEHSTVSPSPAGLGAPLAAGTSAGGPVPSVADPAAPASSQAPAQAGRSGLPRAGLGAPIPAAPASSVAQRLPVATPPGRRPRPESAAPDAGAPMPGAGPTVPADTSGAGPVAAPRPLPVLPVARHASRPVTGPDSQAGHDHGSTTAAGPRGAGPVVSRLPATGTSRPARAAAAAGAPGLAAVRPTMGARPLRPAVAAARDASDESGGPPAGDAAQPAPVAARWSHGSELPATVSELPVPARAGAPVPLQRLAAGGAAAPAGSDAPGPALRELTFPSPGVPGAGTTSLGDAGPALGDAAARRSAGLAPLALARPSAVAGSPAAPAPAAPVMQRIVADPAPAAGGSGSGSPAPLQASPAGAPGLPVITATPVVQRVDGAAPPAAVGPTGPSERELDELARALYGRIQTRLRTEVIHEREARGLGFDAF